MFKILFQIQVVLVFKKTVTQKTVFVTALQHQQNRVLGKKKYRLL